MAKEVLLSDGPGHSSGGHGDFSAPPPPGGLGNFKGVMLCNRPAEISMDKAVRDAEGPPPFKSTVSATHKEQIGLNPCKGEGLKMDDSLKRRGPSAALRRHVKWLKELQKQMGEERQKVEEDEVQEEARKSRLKNHCEKQREAVRQLLTSDCDITHEDLHHAVKGGGEMKTKDGKKVKPLWAMSEEEKREFEAKEEDSLIEFAEGLDFDKYIGDLEFRQGLEVLKDRAGKLKKEETAFKDALIDEFNASEEASTAVGSPREVDLEHGIEGSSLGDGSEVRSQYSRASRSETKRNADGRPEWDSSTNAGDERSKVDENDKEVAARVLESNPQIRGVHSEKAVQKIIEKQREQAEKEKAKEIVALVDQLKSEIAAPAPVIICSEDMQGKAKKKVDPSMLPYLYRSPAI